MSVVLEISQLVEGEAADGSEATDRISVDTEGRCITLTLLLLLLKFVALLRPATLGRV